MATDIAIVGMASVFPGASNVTELWHLLENGLNTVSEIPRQRFDSRSHSSGQTPGRTMHHSARGNFIKDVDAFDNAFFRLSPREARSIDPQQRLLLHVAYDALENAGYVPAATPSFNPDTFATFIGVATNDYLHNLRTDIDVYYSTGTLQAFLSGKISYTFGFGGPSIVLDTACSASIVAIHQACRALHARDCNAVLAGGVNVITSPDMYIGLARGHFLSPTGQCRPWDASADGYCRSEGCGLFVLKRLSDALAENDTILGVIRGTHVNHSGNARSITHPHVPAHVSLLENLVRAARVHPHAISVAECHGTGTQAGDPAELQAVRTVFAVDRSPDNPLHLTSIKANIGHAEAASGAASLAKLLLMMQAHTIPRHVSFERLNPKIPDLAVDNVRIDTENVPWSCTSRRLALLTNFGAAGSNAALILEEYVHPPRNPDGPEQCTGLIVGLSARSVAAVEQRRAAYIAQLESPSVNNKQFLEDFAYSATARRQLHNYRISASGRSHAEVLASLRTAPVTEATAAQNVLFVFSGQGSQYPGMGGDLYRELPCFASIVNECDGKLVRWGYPGVADVFCGRGERFEAVQAALFVLEYALARLWMSWGVRLAALIGHSFGEYAALVIAGVLNLDDGLKLVAVRARLIATECVIGRTSMSSVRASAERLKPLLASFSDLEICCFNSASHCTVGGTIEQLNELDVLCAAQGLQCTRLDVPYAYHSTAMNPILHDLRALGRTLHLSPPEIPVLSNIAGTLIQPGDLSIFAPDYFARHCREPARFHQGITDLQARIALSGVAACVELGPHPTTLSLLRSCQAPSQTQIKLQAQAQAQGFDISAGGPLLLPTLRRAAPAFETLCASLAQLYAASAVPLQWRNVFADLAPRARLVSLPPYPFADTRFWVPYEEPPLPAQTESVPRPRASIPKLSPEYALLDRRIPLRGSASDAVAFETDIDSTALVVDLIQGHKVAGVALCPALVYAELALASAVSALRKSAGWNEEEDVLSLSEVVYAKPLVYASGATLRTEVTVFDSAYASSHSLPRPQPYSQKYAGRFSIASVEDGGGEPQTCSFGLFTTTTAGALASKWAYKQAALERAIDTLTLASAAGPFSRERATETFNTRTVYSLLFPGIVEYAERYRTIKSITVDASSSSPSSAAAYAVAQLPHTNSSNDSKVTATSANAGAFVVDPVFVDTLFHTAGFLVNFALGMNGRDAYICSHVDKIKLLLPALRAVDTSTSTSTSSTSSTCTSYGVHAAVTRVEQGTVAVDVYAVALDGPRKKIVACLKRARFRKVALAGLARVLRTAAGCPASKTQITTSELPITSLPPSPPSAVGSGSHQHQLQPAGFGLQADETLQVLAEITGIPINEIKLDAQLAHLGIDSLMTWELVARLRTLVPGSDVDTHALSEASSVGDLLHIVSDLHDSSSGAMSVSSTSATLCEDYGAEELVSSPFHATSQHNGDLELILPASIIGTPTALIEAVKDVLAAVLEIPADAIDAHTELESLGLDSITSIEARHTLKARLGVDVGEESMFDCRTLKDLVRALSPGPPALMNRPTVFEPPSSPELVRLQTCPVGSEGAPPLFLIHDGSGFVGSYAKLAPLGRDVWGIQNTRYSATHALAGVQTASVLHAMAAGYVEMIAGVFSQARATECFVGGWSFGGVVAYEIARQSLEAPARSTTARVVVAGLVLIDSPPPQTTIPLSDELILWVVDRFSLDADMDSRNKPLNDAARRAREHICAQMHHATRALVAYDHTNEHLPNLNSISYTNSAAPMETAEYKYKWPRAVLLRSREAAAAAHASGPCPVPGLFGAQPEMRGFFKLTNDTVKEGDDSEDEWTVAQWKAALGADLSVLEIPGDHFEVFDEENVAEVSKQLKRAVQWLQSR